MSELTDMADMLLVFVKKFGFWLAIVVIVGYLIKKTWFWFVIPALIITGLGAFWPELTWSIPKVTCLWIAVIYLLGKVFKVER